MNQRVRCRYVNPWSAREGTRAPSFHPFSLTGPGWPVEPMKSAYNCRCDAQTIGSTLVYKTSQNQLRISLTRWSPYHRLAFSGKSNGESPVQEGKGKLMSLGWSSTLGVAAESFLRTTSWLINKSTRRTCSLRKSTYCKALTWLLCKCQNCASRRKLAATASLSAIMLWRKHHSSKGVLASALERWAATLATDTLVVWKCTMSAILNHKSAWELLGRTCDPCKIFRKRKTTAWQSVQIVTSALAVAAASSARRTAKISALTALWSRQLPTFNDVGHGQIILVRGQNNSPGSKPQVRHG